MATVTFYWWAGATPPPPHKPPTTLSIAYTPQSPCFTNPVLFSSEAYQLFFPSSQQCCSDRRRHIGKLVSHFSSIYLKQMFFSKKNEKNSVQRGFLSGRTGFSDILETFQRCNQFGNFLYNQKTTWWGWCRFLGGFYIQWISSWRGCCQNLLREECIISSSIKV